MNTSDSFDELLARELHKTRPQLPDDGFADQVMTALPVRRASSQWRDWLIIALAALLVALPILAQWPLTELLDQLWQWFQTADWSRLAKTGAVVSLATLLAGFGWLAREMELL